MLKCSFMDRQEKVHIPTYSTAEVAIFRFAYVCNHYFYCGEKPRIKSVCVIVCSGLSLNP